MKNDPYRFGVIPDIFDTKFLNQVILEIKDNSRVQFKESDLFRVYQSIDLANVQEGMATVLKLRSVLYSQQFRNMIEEMTGIPSNTLTTKVDCACNCHMTGCHLLCHDDVINTRKVSYILYLTEPNWKNSEGGSLEIYDNVKDPHQPGRIPEAIPKSFVLPLFNSLAFFEVRPGISFHSVQEVLGDRPRLSLQGWYHAAEAPDDIENATLQRLKQMTDQGLKPYLEYADFKSEELSPDDFAYLEKFIQPTYLTTDAIEKVNRQFEENSSVQLRGFLKDKWVSNLSQDSLAEEIENGDPTNPSYYSLGVSKTWETVGPPHKQRFLQLNTNHSDPIGDVLVDIQNNLLQSVSFARYLKRLTGLGIPVSHRGCIRRFRKGRDYTVAHYGILTKEPVLDATLCFVKDDEAWESGESGGFECYIAADDDDGAPADEYDQDDDTELLSVSPSMNTLSLVYRDPGTMRFVKYISAGAPSSRLDIAMEFNVRDEETQDE